MAKFNIHIGDAGEGMRIIGAEGVEIRLKKGAWDFALRVSESLGIADCERGQPLPADDDVILRQIQWLVADHAIVKREMTEARGEIDRLTAENTRLIAAAPELLAVLKEVLRRKVEPKHIEDELGTCPGDGLACRGFRAIAKAEGR